MLATILGVKVIHSEPIPDTHKLDVVDSCAFVSEKRDSALEIAVVGIDG